MNNDRIPRRPLFGLEDSCYRCPVQRIRSQPINRLGGQRHQPSRAQNRGCATERRFGPWGFQLAGIDGEVQGLHSLIVASARRLGPAAFILAV